jgi:uncharacterized protein (DUF427 family)
MKAIWNDTIIAESDDIVEVEGNAYFPLAALDRRWVVDSATRTVCGWKGEASYYSLKIGAHVNNDAAWYYPNPKPAAASIAGRVAFWRGVEIRR